MLDAAVMVCGASAKELCWCGDGCFYAKVVYDGKSKGVFCLRRVCVGLGAARYVSVMSSGGWLMLCREYGESTMLVRR